MQSEVLTVIQETVILGKDVRLYRSIEEPLFEASEVAGWLGVQNVSQMLKQADIDESEKAIFLKYTLGGNQKTLFITEDAMYEVLMRSRKKEAKPFRKEIKKYLKSIRLTGAAIPEGREQEMVNYYFSSLSSDLQGQIVNELIEKNKELQQFYDDLMNTEGLMQINTVAKELGIGEYTLFAYLRGKKIFFYDKDKVNVPYERFRKEGKFVVKETPCHDGNIRAVTYATKKGLGYIRKILRKDGYYNTEVTI
ncbi:phage antirepressor [Acetivibrio ethanolgignens]|uniref:Bro-N domain-containing protein n=1 Tax=Acetivibrio ethanolgignens TaxID=290052 RepID=A0A0V8QAW9_9FIRM|nr:phage antirepressor KilAC domain-containing protein [Acetivibrio ethanolgignens]KSV57687.1 hypothetical protein ASU35_15595 [Acetivibrio ethanolgignens]